MVYVSIGRSNSELLSNSMKVSRGGIIMKSHCCDADTYNRKVGLFLRNARVSFIMQSTVIRSADNFIDALQGVSRYNHLEGHRSDACDVHSYYIFQIVYGL